MTIVEMRVNTPPSREDDIAFLREVAKGVHRLAEQQEPQPLSEREMLETHLSVLNEHCEYQRNIIVQLQPDLNRLAATVLGTLAPFSIAVSVALGVPLAPLAVAVGCGASGVLALWGALTIYHRHIRS